MHVASTLDLALAFTAEMAVCSALTIAGKGDDTSMAVLRPTMLNTCPGSSEVTVRQILHWIEHCTMMIARLLRVFLMMGILMLALLY